MIPRISHRNATELSNLITYVNAWSLAKSALRLAWKMCWLTSRLTGIRSVEPPDILTWLELMLWRQKRSWELKILVVDPSSSSSSSSSKRSVLVLYNICLPTWRSSAFYSSIIYCSHDSPSSCDTIISFVFSNRFSCSVESFPADHLKPYNFGSCRHLRLINGHLHNIHCVRKKVNHCIHFHDSGKQCRILAKFCSNNATSNCK